MDQADPSHLSEEQKIATILTLQKRVRELERQLADSQMLHHEAEQKRVKIITESIHNISHEFRTPLTIIGTSAHLIRKITQSDKVEKYVLKIEHEVQKIVDLIEGLLMVSQLDGGTALEFKPVKVNFLIQQVVNSKQHLMVIHTQLLPHDRIIHADETYLRRMLEEILNNAIQHSHDGGHIVVSTSLTDENITVIVEDHGVGMPSAVLGRVFDRFYRGDKARTTSGLGLGLPIAKHIVELHNGQINITSALNKGTKVTITLPAT